jgi:hypothetical protein
MKNRLLAVTALLLVGLTVAACASRKYRTGEITIMVINGGEGPVSGIRVEHGFDSHNYGTLLAGEQAESRFRIDPRADMVLRYVTSSGVLKEKTFELRILPEHGGTVEMHIDRDGEARITARYYLYR